MPDQSETGVPNVELHTLSFAQIERLKLSVAPEAMHRLHEEEGPIATELPIGEYYEDSVFVAAGVGQLEVVLELSRESEARDDRADSRIETMTIRNVTAVTGTLGLPALTFALDFAAGISLLSGRELQVRANDRTPPIVFEELRGLGWQRSERVELAGVLRPPADQINHPIMKFLRVPSGMMFDAEQVGTYRLPEPKRTKFSDGDTWSVATIPSAASSEFHEEQRVADRELEEDFWNQLFLRPEHPGQSRRPTAAGESEGGGDWVEIPTPEASSKEMLWHYTDAGGVIGILRSGALWATNIDSLNDSTELHHGFSVIESLLAKVRGSRHVAKAQKEYLQRVVEAAKSDLVRRKLYVFCASEAQDSLSQWRGYGGGPGYAVGLASERAPLISNVVDVVSSRAGLPPQWSKVIYDPSDQEHLAARALGYIAHRAPRNLSDSQALRFIVGEDARYLTRIAACFKHPSFAEEQEVRVLLDADGVESALQFRAGRFGVTPYVEAAFGEVIVEGGGTPVALGKRDELPIRSIMVGPASHPEAATSGIEILTECYGVVADILSSEAPYRT